MTTGRDDFPFAIKRALAERAGVRCSFQPCRAVTIGPSDESSESSSSVGVACHITAASPGGRRYDSSKTPEKRSSIENGIWMCETHAKLIDTDEATYPTDLLIRWRLEAEAVAKSSIGVPADIVEELVGKEKRVKPATAVWEMELNRLVAHRLRDAISALRFPIALFVSRFSVNADRTRRHDILNTQRNSGAKDQEISDLLNAVCRPELRSKTSGPIAPPNVRWIDWMFQGALDCVSLCDKSLVTYAGRADAELIVATEELFRRINSIAGILKNLDAHQGEKLYGDVGRSYFKLVLERMLESEATWINYLAKNYKN